MAFQPIKRILPDVVQSRGIARQIYAFQVLEIARKTLERRWGSERAALIRAVSFRDGTLTLGSRAPAALSELRLDETQLINEINRALDQRVVFRIRATSEGF